MWLRSKRYGGKGCLNAVDNVEQIIAPHFLGRKLNALGSLADVDHALLALELEMAQARQADGQCNGEERILTMQRKANLGMNAVLSMSLAMGRLLAAREGAELPDILRAPEPAIDREALYGVKNAAERRREGERRYRVGASGVAIKWRTNNEAQEDDSCAFLDGPVLPGD